MGMGKSFVRVTLIVFLAAIASATVFAQERESITEPLRSGYNERNRDIEDLEEEDERIRRKIEEETDYLNTRIEEIHRTIEFYFSAITIIVAIATIFIGGLTVFFTIKHELNVRGLRHDVDSEVGTIKLIGREAREALIKIGGYEEVIREKLNSISKFEERKMIELTSTIEDTVDPEEQKSEYKGKLEGDASLIYDINFLYLAAIKGDISDEVALVNIGDSLYYQNRYEESAEIFRLLININPGSYIYRNKLGYTLIELSDLSRALIEFNKVIVMNPRYPFPYYNLARVYALQEIKEQMIKYLEIAISKDGRAREAAKKNKDFDAYRDDPDFRRLVYPEDFNEGEESG